MLIGTQYADNKMYSGGRYYDGLPLSSEDIHEHSDTVHMKNSYIMDNIIGQGVLNDPGIVISSSGISLTDPAAILLHGDVCLVQADNTLVSMSDITSVGLNEGVVCIVGWYQHLTASSTLRNYGGVNNSILENDLIREPFGIQVSSRYQFRWLPVILSKQQIESESFSFTIYNRDATGTITSGSSNVTVKEKLANAFSAYTPATMTYADSDIYIVPLVEYSYASGSITSATLYNQAVPKGSSELISNNTEPTGKFPAGTIWFNPITREFKIYVEGEGFVDSAATMALLQYQHLHRMEIFQEIPTNIVVPIGIEEYEEGDFLQVIYEGLVLIEGEHYSIQHANKTITLLGFTASNGDLVTFNVTKLVKANDITNITAVFTNHMIQTANGTDSSHVKLSDTADSTLNIRSGVAATPKAVSDSKIITDNTTNIKYKFGIDNGLVYIEEV